MKPRPARAPRLAARQHGVVLFVALIVLIIMTLAGLALLRQMGVGTSIVGAYASYFFDGSTGGCIVTLQSALFVLALIFGRKHGLIAARARRREASMGASAT